MATGRRWTGPLRRALRRARLGTRRGAVVLAYHRIADVALDPSALAVTPERFAEQMRVLRELAEPVPLARLAGSDRRAADGRRAVAVTFDDGYADNLTEAAPVLERLGIPATVFVPSCAIGRRAPFWWDELEALVFDADTLPATLDLDLRGTRIRAAVQDDGGGADRGGLYRDWRVWVGPAVTPRQRLYAVLWRALRPLPPEGREAALDRIAEWAGYDRDSAPAHPTLDRDGLRRLAASGLIELGGHTVSHSPLNDLPVEEQVREIEDNRRTVEAIGGAPVRAFSYPYGLYSDTTVSLVSGASYAVAVTTRWGAVTRTTDRLRLPRLSVGDWDAATFAGHLRRLLPRR